MAILTADSQGKISGGFTIPANVTSGSKAVVFYGKGGSRGDATFYGQGKLTTTVMKKYSPPVDPLAQTFMFERQVQLCGLDLWFTAKDSEVRVEIREVANGVPGRLVIGEASVQPEQISVNGNHTRILFDAPILCEANTEYAFVVLCDDPKTKLAIAQMGKFDQKQQQWVTQQPYSIGVLLSSSNAASWTPHQDMDLAFRLLEADFGNSEDHIIDLGVITVENCTDLILTSVNEVPTAQCRVEYELTLPDGTKQIVDTEQTVSFGQSIDGEIGVKARLCGSSDSSPVLLPDTRILVGTTGTTGTYYSRSIPATNATKLSVIYDATVPSGSSVKPEVQVDSGEWEEIPATGNTIGDDGAVEFRFSKAISGAAMAKMRLTLTGTLAARPTVRNIRFLATA